MAQAGNVWLKLADYGISQVSVKLTFTITPSLMGGTPGYVAPEVFGVTGREISAEKVHVCTIRHFFMSQKLACAHIHVRTCILTHLQVFFYVTYPAYMHEYYT